jgi:hypothetical protein
MSGNYLSNPSILTSAYPVQNNTNTNVTTVKNNRSENHTETKNKNLSNSTHETQTNSLIKEIIKEQPKDLNKNTEVKNEPVDELYNFMDLMTNLKLISHLKENDKLTHTEVKMEIDTRYYLQGIRRWLYGDSREETIKYIDRIIRSADVISDKFIKSKSDDDKYNLKLLTEDLIACRNGLNNLKITYNEDKLFISTIENFIEKIKIRINKNN